MEQWERSEIMSFWGRHYHPSNATLYVVGDIDVEHTKALIQETFGRVPPSQPSQQAAPAAAEVDAGLLAAAAAPTTPESAAESSAADAASNGALLQSLPRQTGLVSLRLASRLLVSAVHSLALLPCSP